MRFRWWLRLCRSNVSAEIYVVCTGYLAPAQLDPKLLDGKHVFSELPDQVKRVDIIHPEVRARPRTEWLLLVRLPLIAYRFLFGGGDAMPCASSRPQLTETQAQSRRLRR